MWGTVQFIICRHVQIQNRERKKATDIQTDRTNNHIIFSSEEPTIVNWGVYPNGTPIFLRKRKERKMGTTTKPTISDYEYLKTALQKIANLKNYEFRTWHARGDRMQQIAKQALCNAK